VTAAQTTLRFLSILLHFHAISHIRRTAPNAAFRAGFNAALSVAVLIFSGISAF
jgi:hypothetical protein